MATEWAPLEMDDPFAPGQQCKVWQVVSYGSYIYEWPSKYDQVFWPDTDEEGLWFCLASGYISLIEDFYELTDAEKSRIAPFLAKHYTAGKTISIADKLKLFEALYELREASVSKRAQLLRLLAYWYENRLEDQESANRYRRAALEKIRGELKRSDLPEGERFEYLYVAANYEREFGNVEQSARDLAALRAALDALKDQKIKGYADYVRGLLKDTTRIVPGGKLAPEREARDEPEDEPETRKDQPHVAS